MAESRSPSPRTSVRVGMSSAVSERPIASPMAFCMARYISISRPWVSVYCGLPMTSFRNVFHWRSD